MGLKRRVVPEAESRSSTRDIGTSGSVFEATEIPGVGTRALDPSQSDLTYLPVTVSPTGFPLLRGLRSLGPLDRSGPDPSGYRKEF